MAFLEVHHFREVPKWWAIWKFKRWEDAIFDLKKNTKKQLEPLCSPFSVENRHPKRPFVHHDGHHTNSKETLGLSLRDLLQFYPSTFVSCHDSKVPNHAASFPGLLQKHIFYFQIYIYIYIYIYNVPWHTQSSLIISKFTGKIRKSCNSWRIRKNGPNCAVSALMCFRRAL